MPELLDPKEILEKLNLKEDMIAADFGSGSGGWAIPLAKILDKGKVFAIDIQSAPLSVLEGRAKIEKVSNIVKILADVEKPLLNFPKNCCDLVLMTDLLFQVEDKEAVFENAKMALKEKGKVLVVDWKENSNLGPKDKKVNPEEIKKIAQNIGFSFLKEIPAGSYHFCLLFEK